PAHRRAWRRRSDQPFNRRVSRRRAIALSAPDALGCARLLFALRGRERIACVELRWHALQHLRRLRAPTLRGRLDGLRASFHAHAQTTRAAPGATSEG